MRATINTELFKEFEFLSKEDILKALKLIDRFAHKNSYELENLDISINNLEFLLTKKDNVLHLNQRYVKLFINNSETVRKHRAKKKEVISETGIKETKIDDEKLENAIETATKEEDIKVKKPKKTVTKINRNKYNYKSIIDLFNETFKDTQVPAVTKITDAVIRQIDKLYEVNKDRLDGNYTIDEFYEIYFNECHERKAICNGWENTKIGNHFQPAFVFIMRENTFNNVYAPGNGKYYM